MDSKGLSFSFRERGGVSRLKRGARKELRPPTGWIFRFIVYGNLWLAERSPRQKVLLRLSRGRSMPPEKIPQRDHSILLIVSRVAKRPAGRKEGWLRNRCASDKRFFCFFLCWFAIDLLKTRQAWLSQSETSALQLYSFFLSIDEARRPAWRVCSSSDSRIFQRVTWVDLCRLVRSLYGRE